MKHKEKKIAIIQSNYIPWKGYFDIINLADEFILFDDAQYTRRDWRNRNKIKTPKGSQWISIPVMVKNKYFQKIRDTKIADRDWGAKHWKKILHNYAKAGCFGELRDRFEELYLDTADVYLSDINYRFMTAICDILGIETKISWSGDYGIVEGKTERLIDLCRKTGATEYLSGPTARGYIDEGAFAEESIKLSFMDYSGYAEYPQCYHPFDHRVSIIDLIFNTGRDAPRFMKSFKQDGGKLSMFRAPVRGLKQSPT